MTTRTLTGRTGRAAMGESSGVGRGRLSAALLGAAAVVASAGGAWAGNVDFPRYPSISPDGQTISFSWRGDIFTAPLDFSEPSVVATRLTNHPLDELYSTFTTDGRGLIFTSEQTGYTNLFAINTDGTNVRQITDTDRFFIPTQMHPTERSVLGHSSREGDVYRPGIRPYVADMESGLLTRVHDAFGSFPTASPDGRLIAFVRGSSSWDRRHYRGPDSRDVWLYDTGSGSFSRLTTWAGNDGAPRFRDSDTVLFLSDRELDTVNLYEADLVTGGRAGEYELDAGSVRRLTSFEGRDVQWYDVSADGRRAVLHVWDTLYAVELRRSGEPRELIITAAEDFRDNVALNDVDRDVTGAAISPDGEVMAYVAYGEVFVRHLEEGSPTRRVTEGLNGGHAREESVVWSPDGTRLYFQSDADGTESIYMATVSLTRGEIKEEVASKLGLEDDAATAATDEGEGGEGGEGGNGDGSNGDGVSGPVSHEHPAQGRWDAEARSPEGLPNGANEMSFTMEITADAEGQLSVSLSVMDTALTATSVSYDGGRLSVSFEFVDGTPIEVQGEVTGATMAGTWSGLQTSGTWSATRSTTFPTPAEVGDGGNDEGDADEADGEPSDETGADDDEPVDPKLDPERWRDAVRFDIEPVVQTEHNDMEPMPTPDGLALSFRRDRGDVWVYDLVTGEERLLIESWDRGIDWRFSSDGEYVAYAASDLNFNTDVFVAPMDGSFEPVNISMHPDNDGLPRWSHDGKVLAFISERRDEEYDVYAVYLDASLDSLPAVELEEYYEEAVSAAKKLEPVEPIDFEKLRSGEAEDAEADESAGERDELDLEDAYLRIRRITSLEGSEWNLELTPGGDRFVFTGTADGSAGLYSVDWKGQDRKRLTASASVQHLSPTAGKVVYVRGGQAGTVNPSGGGDEVHSIDYTMRIDLAEQASQKFVEMARTLGDNFYHNTMKGLDWDALTERYHRVAMQTRTADEFEHVGERFLGELNASHLGVSPPSPSSELRQPAGRLGADLAALPQGDGTVWYRVERLIPRGPAQQTEMQLEAGDVITAVELEPIVARAPEAGIESALKGRIGRETIVTVRRVLEGESEPTELNLLVTPISYGAEVGLRYEDWVSSNRKTVHEMSDGRLGYLHIRAMGGTSLEDFERDLYAAGYGRDGMIVDVRNNPGGWITDRLLSSIMVRPHAYTIPRGGPDPDDPSAFDAYPQDRLYIQRYTKPMNLLINEKSFSNAEIFAHAFKTLRRGTVIGKQTYGGVISTGGFRLIDGTFVRLPFRGWYLPDGTDMENNGAMPDITIDQTPEMESAGDDEQLKAAVRELLNRLDNAAEGERTQR